ncbi:MAG: hypothetical protein J7L94_05650 [Caldisericaceae bacterium]|nr:hypothetical protein [Caldisericaceae bacterium]
MAVKARLLTAEDVDRCLSMNEVIDALADAFQALQQGQVDMPLRTALPIPEAQANSLMMPVYMSSLNMIGVKVVNIFKNNLELGLPAIHALIMLFDGSTGQPLALLDGERITALRTGAVCGLASRYLAREDSHVVAIIGAGIQGRSLLEAMMAVRPIRKVLVIDKDLQRANLFISEMSQKYGVIFQLSDTGQLLEADIVCTATTSEKPVFDASHLTAGTHINGVGSYRPQTQEIPEQIVSQAKIVVDLKSAALKEAGDLIVPLKKGLISEERIYAELGQLVVGEKAGRSNDQEITFFKSVGLALQDLATAHLALQKAQQQDLGSEIFI